MKLFEFAVVYQPKKKDGGAEKAAATILVPTTLVLARDEKHAAMLAARAVPSTHAEQLDEVDIAVRPF